MDSYDLPFAKINILQDDIAEVFVKEDIDVNVSMVDELHRFLIEPRNHRYTCNVY